MRYERRRVRDRDKFRMERGKEDEVELKRRDTINVRTPEVMAEPIALTVLFMPATGSEPVGGADSELNEVCTALMSVSSVPMPPCVCRQKIEAKIGSRKHKW